MTTQQMRPSRLSHRLVSLPPDGVSFMLDGVRSASFHSCPRPSASACLPVAVAFHPVSSRPAVSCIFSFVNYKDFEF